MRKIVSPSEVTTLVINKAYMPTHVITARLAFNHLLTGRGFALGESGNVYKGIYEWENSIDFYDEQPVLRSASRVWAIPTIVIAGPAFFKRKKSGRRKLSDLVKLYDYTCQITGKKFGKKNWRKHFSIEHVFPVSLGGPNDDWNYLPTCKEANRIKADTYPYYDNEGVNLEDKVKKPNSFIYVEPKNFRKEWEQFHMVKKYAQ